MGDELAHAEAAYDFNGMREDNLSFSKGDIIMVTEFNENGWWKGINAKGQVGIFPYNYVIVREEVEAAFPILVTLYDFDAMGHDQLSFQKDEELTLVKEVNVDWWIGRNARGEEGMFPANRVKKTDRVNERAIREEKRRWDDMEKEKKKEAEALQQRRTELEKLERKQKDEEERRKLAKEKREFEERARKAEEELARVKAEAEMMKQQALAAKERTSVKRTSIFGSGRSSVKKHKLKVANKARISVKKFQGMSPGPPPPMKKKAHDDDDDLFGPAPPVAPPPERRRAGSTGTTASEAAQDEEPEPEARANGSSKKEKPAFKHNPKFAGLGGGSKCKACGKSVGFADKVKALNAEWHKNCFRCSTCSCILRQGEYRENKLNPYCIPCHAAGFGPKGFGFGGSLAFEVDIGKTAGTTGKNGEVDSRPQFEAALKQ